MPAGTWGSLSSSSSLARRASKRRAAEALADKLVKRRAGGAPPAAASIACKVSAARLAQALHRPAQNGGRSDWVWQAAHRQLPALEAYRVAAVEAWGACSAGPLACPPLKVVSCQSPADGSRRFVAGSAAELWRRIHQLAPPSRHFYELVCEDTPCHLYFDLEFSKQANAGVSGPALTHTLLQWVAQHARDVFGPLASFDARHVLLLESSTPTKFSQHVHIRFPSGAVFRCVSHAGAFVLSLVQRLLQWRQHDPDIAALWCATPSPAAPDAGAGSSTAPAAAAGGVGGETAFIADLAVYTRNRAMRQYLSTKHGKGAMLIPVPCPHLPPATDAPAAPPQRRPLGTPQDAALLHCPAVSPVPPLPPGAQPGSHQAEGAIGSTEWERQVWRFSLITDWRPPLSLALEFLRSMGRSPLPPQHPHACPATGAPLLYMCSVDTAAPWCYHPCAIAAVPFRNQSSISSLAGGILAQYRSVLLQAGSAPTSAQQCSPACDPKSGARGRRPPSGGELQRALPGEAAPRTSGHGDGPWPALAQWVCDTAFAALPVPATVRAWSAQQRRVTWLLPGGQRCTGLLCTHVTFHLSGNRFCRHIGRAHRSNNVSYTVDMARGTAVQTCMDMACRAAGFRSAPLHVPTSALPSQGPPGATLAPANRGVHTPPDLKHCTPCGNSPGQSP